MFLKIHSPHEKDYYFSGVRRHIVGGTNYTLILVKVPPQLCRIGTCRRPSAGRPQIVVALFEWFNTLWTSIRWRIASYACRWSFFQSSDCPASPSLGSMGLFESRCVFRRKWMSTSIFRLIRWHSSQIHTG